MRCAARATLNILYNRDGSQSRKMWHSAAIEEYQPLSLF